MRLAVFLSGGGSNLQALIDASRQGIFTSSIDLVLSNRSTAYGLHRAKEAGIPAFYSKQEAEIIEYLGQFQIDGILLAGFLGILSAHFIDQFNGPILNIHPSLLPAYGGKGMYGIHVHEAVLQDRPKQTGVTVHYVSDTIDQGEIFMQKKIPIPYETIRKAEDLAAYVLEFEHQIYPQAVATLERLY